MIHTYDITGMTCGGCKASVEKYLGNLDNVTNVSVNLDKAEVEVAMSSKVPIEALKKALPEKYLLSEKDDKNDFQMASLSRDEIKQKSKLQQLQPLLIIFLYISIASILMHSKNPDINAIMLDFMGLFFIAFSFFKMLDLKGFTESFSMYDPLAKVIPVYGRIYPFIEISLGLMFLMRVKIAVAVIITLVILGITTIGVIKTLLDKKSIQCACLGTTLKLPMTEATLIENAIMITMAIIILFA